MSDVTATITVSSVTAQVSAFAPSSGEETPSVELTAPSISRLARRTSQTLPELQAAETPSAPDITGVTTRP